MPSNFGSFNFNTTSSPAVARRLIVIFGFSGFDILSLAQAFDTSAEASAVKEANFPTSKGRFLIAFRLAELNKNSAEPRSPGQYSTARGSNPSQSKNGSGGNRSIKLAPSSLISNPYIDMSGNSGSDGKFGTVGLKSGKAKPDGKVTSLKATSGSPGTVKPAGNKF